MRTKHLRLFVVGAIALGVSVGCATTQPPEKTGYVVNAPGEYWRNAAGDCWRTDRWSPDNVVEECDPDLVARPEPPPAPPTPAAPAPRAEPPPPAPPTTMTYEVVRGDSLWRISGRSSVYGNPYQWPLIYKANASQIRDADLIYPGQRLTIELEPSQGDVDAAVRHARTRGAWELGRVEDSDVRYLDQYGLSPKR
ncbi:LysM peptidoglycan-binding domain-containing protein [Thioalkalivibrio thiocyanodenitrificans]|uniref:LysM peptidoglycan-binding domain-containing protein n=1 Tax=Thioalkalivibrio thiocyanodenitrificans TaxID=243063 RepID=UPI000524AF4F|nr:LysM peptidoglycan-binding domain-containing protein [Thioalkalivibrio thiocyanodenitrificans]